MQLSKNRRQVGLINATVLNYAHRDSKIGIGMELASLKTNY